MASMNRDRRAATVNRSAVARMAACVSEALEGRRLFAATLTGTIPADTGSVGGTSTVNLGRYFDDDTANSYAMFTTPVGSYRLKLFDSVKPLTTTNFKKYVDQGRYDGTVVHRSQALDGDASKPSEIVQGGGYNATDLSAIQTDAAIADELTTNGQISNTPRTISMAKSGPNTATSQWFINITDNSSALDSSLNSGGFTVFGEVLDSDFAVVQNIAQLPKKNLGSPFDSFPVLDASKSASPSNAVTTQARLLADPSLTFTVTSADPTIATGSIVDGQLVVTHGTTTGTTTLTVSATGASGPAVQTTLSTETTPFEVSIGGSSGNSSVTYTDGDGTQTTVTLKGAGSASVRIAGSGLAQSTTKGKVSVTGTDVSLNLVTIDGSDATTSVTITSKGGDGISTLSGLSSSGALKSISGKKVLLIGGLTTVGSVGSVQLLSANGGAITLGGGATDAGSTISLGALVNSDINVGSPIKSLKIASSTDTDSTENFITASGIDNLTCSGDNASNILVVNEGNIRKLSIGGNLTGDVTAHQIGAMSVKGSVSGATITSTHGANESAANAAEANQKQNQGINSLKIGGAVTDSVISTAGSVGSLSAASLTNSRVFVGLPLLTTLPTELSQLTQEATFNSLKVKGAMTNSSVATKYGGKWSVGSIATSNGGTPLGFAADSITALNSQTAAGQKIALKKVLTQNDVTDQTANLTLEDLVIRVL